VVEPQHVPGEPCDCGPVCNWTTANPVAGTWLEETLARALHEAFGDHDSEACLDGYDLEHARSLTATPAGQSLAARVAALEAAVPEDPWRYGDDATGLVGWRCYSCGGATDTTHAPDCRWLAVRR
jgi:hypothetical protein